MTAIKKQFLIERQGVTFAKYAGLLDAAHEEGLIAMHTSIVQMPTMDNRWTSICTARAVFKHPESGDVREFCGVGDANPDNVSKAMYGCTVRMAETRAKGRALRDALNLGQLVTEEELGEDEQEPRNQVSRSGHQHEEVVRPREERSRRQETARQVAPSADAVATARNEFAETARSCGVEDKALRSAQTLRAIVRTVDPRLGDVKFDALNPGQWRRLTQMLKAYCGKSGNPPLPGMAATAH